MPRILIELPNWLGDAVMATPSINNFLKNFDSVDLFFVSHNPAVIEIFKKHPNTNNAIFVNKNIFNIYNFAKKSGKFNYFVSYRNTIHSRILKFFISANKKYSYKKNRVLGLHQVQKYNFFTNSFSENKYEPGNLDVFIEPRFNVQSEMIGLNPGGSYGDAKRWNLQEFAKLAKYFSSHYQVLILGGNEEVESAQEIENYLQDNGINNFQNLAGKTSISDLIELINNLELLVTNDSGTMHIAAALKTPTVSVFGPTNYIETSQWKNNQSFIEHLNLECQPCMKRSCPLKHHNCMNLLKAERVIKTILDNKLLKDLK